MNIINDNIVNILLQKNLTFAIYSLPGSTDFELVIQKDNKLHITDFEDIAINKAFVLAGFDSARTNEIFLINPDIVLNNKQSFSDFIQIIQELPSFKPSEPKKNNHFLSKIEYLQKTDYLIDKLKKGDLQKIVISRNSPMELSADFDIQNFINALIETYPDAFVYLTNTSEYGLWAGATPELLIEQNNKNIKTMAVAGTQLWENYIEKKNWGEKEIEEQKLVSDYIEKLLSELGITNFEMSKTETVKAGNLAHLRTVFNIVTDNTITGEIIKGLHPTPAVCGLPKAEAFNTIKNAETYKRELYTGFLGPWQLNGHSKLFVNLRCAKILKEKIMFYVGGGLTADSDAKAEWQETVNKTKTLLSVIENL